MPSEMGLKGFPAWLQNHAVRGGTRPITHTAIPHKARMMCGARYHIEDSELPEFNKLYHQYVFIEGNPLHLTETQREVGPIMIDLDYRYEVGVDTRQHTAAHNQDIVEAYAEILQDIVALNEIESYDIWVMEKPNVNQQEEQTKDGVHIVVGLLVDRATRKLIRDRAMEELPEVLSDLPLTNPIEEVIDKGVSLGTCQWQLYGSCKPKNETYRIVQAYRVTEGGKRVSEAPGSIQSHHAVLANASARSLGLPHPDIRESWKDKHSAEMKTILGGRKKFTLGSAEQAHDDTSTDHSSAAAAVAHVTATLTPEQESQGPRIIGQPLSEIRTQIDLMLDELPFHESHLQDAHAYAMALGPEYYDPRDKWLRVCWALRNTSTKLFGTWVLFSARSKKFNMDQVAEMRKIWDTPQPDRKSMLTSRSLAHWCRESNPDEYVRLRQSSISQAMELSLQGATEFDIATVMHRIFHNEFRCASIKHRIWYQYTGHYWKKIDEGTSLRMQISQYLSPLYRDEVTKLQNMLMSMDESDESYDRVKKKAGKYNNIAIMLKKTAYKNNVMRECCELFFDEEFLDQLDINPMLLGCENGVIDFEQNIFRPGLPDDYISTVTHIKYDPEVATSEQAAETRAEITEFMSQLFTDPELCEYMWEHLSAVLIGSNVNQTFNLYNGDGENGKSKMVELMGEILGDYKGTVPVTLITSKRTSIGNVSPEIAQLKPCLYAVMQEPSKNDTMNEGILKELTGDDPVQGRGLYQDTVTFVPKFTLAVCCNHLFNIKSGDHGTWRRMAVCEFSSKFCDNPEPNNPKEFKKDKKLGKKFKKWAPVMLVMLANRAFKNKGEVRLCEAVQLASNQYRCSQDHIAEFMSERLEKVPGRLVRKEDVFEEFKEWHQSMHGSKGPTANDLYKAITKTYGSWNKVVRAWEGVWLRHEGETGVLMTQDED
jgi:putative DNA primase/helicase